MSKSTKPVPERYRTVTPYLMVRRAEQAIEFYKRAFNAKERGRMQGPDGRVMHAELQIGDSVVFLCDEFPEMGGKSPEALKGSPVSLFLYVENVDDWFARAVNAGATVKTPVEDQFWGDRWGTLTDPFGHEWQVATHVEDVSQEELEKRSAALFSQK